MGLTIPGKNKGNQIQPSQPQQTQYQQPLQSQQTQYQQPSAPISQAYQNRPKASISLKKGQKADLTKTNPGLRNIVVGLGWDVNYQGGQFDLDTAAFLLSPTGLVNDERDFVFYNNPTHISGSVIHSGDNKTGEGFGDDEQIRISLDRVPVSVSKIAFTVTIDEAMERRQSFGQVSNAYIHIFDGDTNQELIRYDLGNSFSIETAIVVAELYRHNNEWKFSAIGSGYQGGLAALCHNFGINV